MAWIFSELLRGGEEEKEKVSLEQKNCYLLYSQETELSEASLPVTFGVNLGETLV